MCSQFVDHGLPLVALKEQRRDLIIALIGRDDPLSKETIVEIASIQQAIAAIESVICDLDAEMAAFQCRQSGALGEIGDLLRSLHRAGLANLNRSISGVSA